MTSLIFITLKDSNIDPKRYHAHTLQYITKVIIVNKRPFKAGSKEWIDLTSQHISHEYVCTFKWQNHIGESSDLGFKCKVFNDFDFVR